MPGTAGAETPQRNLVVLGAGVIGLTIAYLAATDPDVTFNLTVVARDMPEDMDSQAWASPFAGASWSPQPAAATDQRVFNWEVASFNKFWDMIPTGLVKKLPSKIFVTCTRDPSELWWGKLVRELHELDQSEIPEPYKFGVGYYTISVNPQEYIPWLKSELLSRGVSFEKRHVRSLGELRPLVGPAGILVNATSLGARSIIGVEDTKLYPICGQAILIKSPKMHEFLAVESDDHLARGEVIYIIPRPGTKDADTVLLGGTYQPGNWDTSLHMDTAQRIFERCAEIAPSLKDNRAMKILRHQVGLRPAREGGARVEAEVVSFPLSSTHSLVPWDSADVEGASGGMQVVHAYGFGAGGYQASWGAAADVLTLVKNFVEGWKEHVHVI